MRTSNEPKGRKARFHVALPAIPDGLIKLYFGLFPIVVATFLSVQAVRAHTAQEEMMIPADYPVMGIAR